MRIAHIIWGLGLGGSEAMLVDIVNEQSRSHTVALTIVNSMIDTGLLSKVDNRVTLIRGNRTPGDRNLLDIARVRLQLHRFRPDVVHCHDWSLARLLRYSGFKLVLTLHDTHIDAENTDLARYIRIFAVSEAVAVDFAKRLTGTKPVVVYNGIDCSAVCRRTVYDYTICRMIQISRLDHIKKAQDVLMRALHQVVHVHGATGIHLDFVGEGNARAELEAMARALGIETYCSFLGKMDREAIYGGLRDYHLLVQPSNFEGFGLTIVEAMAAKIPVLVSNVEGPMEVIQKGRLGYWFEVGNPEDCARQIIRVMADYRSGDVRQKTDLAYAYARECFDIRRTAAEYASQYQCLVP